jgi:hypothetical protein
MSLLFAQLPAPEPPRPPDNYPDYENSWIIEEQDRREKEKEKENQRMVVIQL